MERRRVDYDRVAPTYNQRFENERTRTTADALRALANQVGARKILEVGCGTGRWLADLAPDGQDLYGLDYSIGMLQQACQRAQPLMLIQGQAGLLPLPDHAFDLVYCVNAIHHFDRQEDFVGQARRLLRPGGALAVIGMDPRQHRDRYYVYDYFDGTFERDLDRFPSWGTVLDWMIDANFERIEWRMAERIIDHKLGRAVLDDPFLKKNAASQLTLLSDEAYAAGLARIRQAIAANRMTSFPVDLALRMIVGYVDQSAA